MDLQDEPLESGPGALPMQRQLFRRFKEAILAGRLMPGTRIPASRELATRLSVSRNTVTAAYDLLAAEGFIETDRQGTRVARLSPSQALRAPPPSSNDQPPLAARLAPLRVPPPAASNAEAPLRPGVPALSHFPLGAWRRSIERAIHATGTTLLGYGDPLGEPQLRACIARHLAFARGVLCDPADIVITEGTQEALSLCVRLFCNPGDNAWIEDPGYRGAKAAFRAGDLTLIGMPVDADGVRITEEAWSRHAPKLIYTTPSHQYPMGAVLSAPRRLALIDKAAQHGAWIIEDDYDSDFRHGGKPIGAMQGLTPRANVLYVGTFSKTMFPSLRLGFLVLPNAATKALAAPLQHMLRGGHRIEQWAMADFMQSGQFTRHLGRMRRLYRERQAALRAAIARHLLSDVVSIQGGMGGMHLTLRLPNHLPDRDIAERARAHGMGLLPLSEFALDTGDAAHGLVLGYGNTASDRFDALIETLAAIIDEADGSAKR